MHVGQDDHPGDDVASLPGDEPSVPADDETAEAGAAPVEPTLPPLPETDTTSPPSVLTTAASAQDADAWYRTDQDRYRSIHRLANPWYRRLARFAIGLSLLAVAAVGLFFAARLVQDYLDRDRLPSAGAEVPVIRATSFELRSTDPAPVLDGTLTIDAATQAFEFIGRGTGPAAGNQVISPDGDSVYVRTGSGGWQRPAAGDELVADVTRAVAYLADDDSADDILTTQLRRGYVELLDRAEIGTGADEIRRYELRLDTRSFESAFPLQYQQFVDEAIPGVQSVRGLLVTITVDADNVLIGVDDAGTNWSWQRLTYSDQPFVPIDPADDAGGTIEITDGTTDDG